MRNTLFRREVEDGFAGQAFGSIRIASPVSHSIWSFGAVAFCLLLMLWLGEGSYTRRYRVSGRLVPSQGISNVETGSAGTAEIVFVHEGQYVAAGSPLVTISAEKSSKTTNDVLRDVLTKLQREKEGLTYAIKDAETSAETQKYDIKVQITALRSQIDHNAKELAIDQQQVSEQREIIDKLSPLLSRGYVSAMQIHEEMSTLLNAKASLEHASEQRDALSQQLAALISQENQISFSTSDKVRENQRNILQLDESIDKADVESEILIRSPLEGVVSSLFIHANQSVDAQQVLMSITPTQGKLQGELLIPSEYMGMIRPGLGVAIHFPAYPFQKFGVFKGTVNSVSRNALDTTEVGRLSGKPTAAQADPAYRVLVDIPSQSIDVYGEQANLLAGTAIDADILLERRRLYEWMFEPIYLLKRHLAEGK